MRTAAKGLALPSADELLARLGASELTGKEVVQAVYPDIAPRAQDRVSADRAVVGLEPGQNFTRAPCCDPLPGERIVGITFRGQGVTVHTIDCDCLSDYEDQTDRWLDLRWHDGSHPAVYTAVLDVTIGNGAGVLGRICTLIGEASANISDLTFTERRPDFYRLLIHVDLRDIEHLHRLITTLEAETDVASVTRQRGRPAPTPDAPAA